MSRLSVFLAVVFGCKLAVVWQLRDHILLQPDAGLDTSVYLALAQRVASGDLALGPGLYYVSPLYIYFVAVVLAITDSIAAIRVVQISLGTAGVGLIWWTAHEWIGARAAWLAAGVAALTGLFTFYESLLLQAALDPFLTAVALAALTAALTRPHAKWFLMAGAAFGVQSLNRPNTLIAAAGLFAMLMVGRRWRGATMMAAGVLIAFAPVTIRNVVVAGDFAPVSSHGGLNFYIGNNPAADGTYSRIPGITPSIVGQQADARRIAEGAAGRPLGDAEVSAYFYGEAFTWIADRPAAALRLFIRKLAYVFHGAHLSLNYSYPFYAGDARSLLPAFVVGPWVLIPLGVSGLGWIAWRRRSSAFLTWTAFVPFYAVAVATFFVSERYRLPLLVPLCVGAGATLDGFVTAIMTRQMRTIAALGSVVAVLAAGANWPLRLDNGRAEERTRMAERLALLRRTADAEAWAARAADGHPLPGVLNFRVGRALRTAGDLEAALRYLQRSAAIDPEQPEVHFALGQTLLDAGRASEAVPHLRRALEAGVRPDLSGYDLARALAASGDRATARRILSGVRPAQADDSSSWYGLGQLAQQLEDFGLAAAFYRESARSAPHLSDPREHLGLMLVLTGDLEAGVSELEVATQINPSDATARLNLAAAYARIGRVAEARRQAQEALRLDPDYAKAAELLKLLGK